MHDISYTCVCTGNILCAIGALGKEPAVINMHNLNVTTDLRGRNLVNVGTCGSTAECRISRTQLNLYAEGSAVSGIGDRDGGGNVHMEDCDLSMTFLTGSCHLIGSPNGSHELIRVIKKISLNE